MRIEHIYQRQIVALADLEIVEVMRWRDLHRARTFFGIGIFVGDDRDEPPHQRQAHPAPDQLRIALVLGMHSHRRVAKHGLRPRRRDSDEFAAVLAVHRHDGIAEVPQMALHFGRHDFKVGDRRLQHGVPIDEPLGLVEQPLAVELHEDLDHRAREPFVEREALARPVAGGPQPLELFDDNSARFRLPFPDALQKLLAAHFAAAALLALRQLTLDHHLRRDARVVGAGLPQYVLALHARVTREDVLQRIVERVAHVQRARDIGRRNDDGIGRSVSPLGPAGAKRARGLPLLADAPLDGGGIESLFHGHGISCRFRSVSLAGRKSLPLAGRVAPRSGVGWGAAPRILRAHPPPLIPPRKGEGGANEFGPGRIHPFRRARREETPYASAFSAPRPA